MQLEKSLKYLVLYIERSCVSIGFSIGFLATRKYVNAQILSFSHKVSKYIQNKSWNILIFGMHLCVYCKNKNIEDNNVLGSHSFWVNICTFASIVNKIVLYVIFYSI